MKLARFEPWTIVDLMHRDLDAVAPRGPGQNSATKPLADWAPAVDIVEEKDRFLLRADVPGVAAADIDVSMDAAVLTISGQRAANIVAEDADVRRAERTTGRFSRRFTLPDTATAEGITAESRNGILEVAIPKQPEVTARRITVKAA